METKLPKTLLLMLTLLLRKELRLFSRFSIQEGKINLATIPVLLLALELKAKASFRDVASLLLDLHPRLTFHHLTGSTLKKAFKILANHYKLKRLLSQL